MHDVHLLTKNKWKFAVAKDTFARFGIQAIQVDKEFPEIQADTSLAIARHAAISAAQELGVPVIREDHSLFITALGFPGPYTQYIERALPAETLLKLLSLFNDRNGYFELALVYADPHGHVEERVFRVPITFSTEPQGTLSGGWNRIIMLKGETRTLAEYPEEERREVWIENYLSIADFILRKKDHA